VSRTDLQVWDSAGGAGTLREAWHYRELVYFLAWRDITVRYKQTAFGAIWAVLQPFLTMLVFTVLFGRIANLPTDGVPRSLFYFSALLPWMYFSSALNSVGLSLISNASLLTKIYFPRVILPTAAAVSGLLDFLVASLMLLAMMIYFDVPFRSSLLLWPILVVQLFMLTLGVGAALAALNVRFRDVKHAIPFGIQLWLFVTPVIYPTSMVPEAYRWLLALNPLTGIVEAFRYAVVATPSFRFEHLAISAVTTLAMFVIGIAFFRKTERDFADVV
jgi:lipopolysaccharide transport system permease protein